MATSTVAHASTCNDAESYVRNFLNLLLKEVMEAVGVECGSLFLCDGRSDELTLDSFYNSNDLPIKGLKRRIGEGVCGKIAKNKAPVLVKDIDVDVRFGRNGYSHYHTKSFICVPVICGDSLIGVINLADKTTGGAFTERDLEVATAIVKYATLALDIYKKHCLLQREKEDFAKQKSLLERYALLGKLASGIVHEVNNPLDGIIRYINLLLSQMDDNHVAREYLIEVKKGLDRIANITKSLLAFSRQVNAAQKEESKFIDLVSVIDESLDMLHHGTAKNIQVLKHVKKEHILLQDFGLHNVVMNMVKNAFDAMPQGGVLEIIADTDAESAFLCITDTGKGMSKEVREHIFEPFYTTKNINEGTGLGLAISKEVIDRYRGAINVYSIPNQGTTFTVIIPKSYLKNE